MQKRLRFLREKARRDKTGDPRSTCHRLRKAGLYPAPVVLDNGTVAWLEHELDALLAARAAGYTEEQIRTLVTELQRRRKGDAEAILAEYGEAAAA